MTTLHTPDDRRRVLDEAADLYDRYRPRYPEQLIDDIVRRASLPPRGRVLEIGCGTGQASLSLAARRFDLTCLEPGARLAQVATLRLAQFPGARVVVSTIEEWGGEANAYDLVLAAQSFHLVNAETALARAAGVLRPGGALAILATWTEPGVGIVHERVQLAYAQHAPEIEPAIGWMDLGATIAATGQFGPVEVSDFRWSLVYDASAYLGLLSTYSPHRLLPAERREALFRSIHDAIAAAHGTIRVEYLSRLQLTRVASRLESASGGR